MGNGQNNTGGLRSGMERSATSNTSLGSSQPSKAKSSKLPLLVLILFAVLIVAGVAWYVITVKQNDESLADDHTNVVTQGYEGREEEDTEDEEREEEEDDDSERSDDEATDLDNQNGLFTYSSDELGVSLEIPADWTYTESYAEPTDTNAGGMEVIFSSPDNNQIMTLTNFIGYHGFCGSEYSGSESPEMNSTTENIIINGESKDLGICNDTSYLLIYENDTINQWLGVEVTGVIHEGDLETVKQVMTSLGTLHS